jgi:hypothetical protein
MDRNPRYLGALYAALHRFGSHCELKETSYCDGCIAGLAKVVSDCLIDERDCFCKDHQTANFYYRVGFRPLWFGNGFKPVVGQAISATASDFASKEGLVVRSQTKCGGCMNDHAPRVPHPEEPEPLYCSEHGTPLFVYCETLDWKPFLSLPVIQMPPAPTHPFECAPRFPDPAVLEQEE